MFLNFDKERKKLGNRGNLEDLQKLFNGKVPLNAKNFKRSPTP